MNDIPLLRCVMCQSPRLEYQADVKIERRVLGVFHVGGEVGTPALAIADECDPDAFGESFQNERFFCLNCHHTMTLDEALEEYEGSKDMLFDFISKSEFNNESTHNAVESKTNDEDHQDDPGYREQD